LAPGREIGILILLGLVLAGVLLWIVQALDAVRQAASTRPTASRADSWSLALLVLLGIFLFTFKEEKAAGEIDRFSAALEERGFLRIPLLLSRAAVELDPSVPLYALRCANLWSRAGHDQEASRVREDLDRKWQGYRAAIGIGSQAGTVDQAPGLTGALLEDRLCLRDPLD
jgi:hypothetical protein